MSGGTRCFQNPCHPTELTADELSVLRSSITEAIKTVDVAALRMQGMQGGGVYVGMAGVALMQLRAYQSQGGKQLISLPRVAALCAEAAKHFNPRHQRVTFLEGLPGLLTVRLMLHVMAGEMSAAASDVKVLETIYVGTVKHLAPGECELLYGRAGYLYCLLLARRLTNNPDTSKSIIQELVKQLIEEGKRGAAASGSSFPLMYAWHGKRYLGAAHGITGICFMLLHCSAELATLYPDGSGIQLVKDTVRSLMQCCCPSGNMPSSVGSTSDRLVQWCHGGPGLISLLCKAHEVLGAEGGVFLEAARKAADDIWQRGLLTKGVGLCHGIGGNGYAFLTLYRTTHDPIDLYRAQRFAHIASEHWKRLYNVPDTPASLFEGLAGCVCFWLDVLNPETSSFPGWEL